MPVMEHEGVCMENFKSLTSLCILLLFYATYSRSSNVLEPAKTVTEQDISTETRETLPMTSSRPALTDSDQRTSLPNRDDETQVFTDEKYEYSIRYPATWKRMATASAPGPPARLYLSTPHHNQLIVSIYPLPARLDRYSSATFDQIGHDHVDTVLSTYRTLLRLKKILREQPEDHSDDRAMIFWQGTSALDEKMRDWVIVSTHVIRYGSDFIINMVFLGGGSELVKDGKNMDQVMGSISFGKH